VRQKRRGLLASLQNVSALRGYDVAQRRQWLTRLFWVGVALAPLAALFLVLGEGVGPLRTAAVLSVVSAVLMGLSVTLREDAASARDEFTEELHREIAALRGELETLRRGVEVTVGRELERVRGEVNQQAPTPYRAEARRVTAGAASARDIQTIEPILEEFYENGWSAEAPATHASSAPAWGSTHVSSPEAPVFAGAQGYAEPSRGPWQGAPAYSGVNGDHVPSQSQGGAQGYVPSANGYAQAHQPHLYNSSSLEDGYAYTSQPGWGSRTDYYASSDSFYARDRDQRGHGGQPASTRRHRAEADEGSSTAAFPVPAGSVGGGRHSSDASDPWG
jgi:hypothetical protein